MYFNRSFIVENAVCIMATDYEKLDKEQRLKAAMYKTIKEIAKEVEEEMDVKMSASVIATLSESVSRQVETYAVDLENFAKHARRTNISVDDVKLVARRNPALLEHLTKAASEKVSQQAHKRKPKTGSSKTGQPDSED